MTSTTTTAETTSGRTGRSWWIPRLSQGDRVRAAVITALLLFVLLILPSLLSGYWTNVCTAVAIYSVVALGLGVLMGRTGLVSLGQIAILALGAWVAARLFFATGLPFPLVLILTGLITMVLGTVVGLPALRLSGLYLALITLMLAGAITVALRTTNFPNGGDGLPRPPQDPRRGAPRPPRPAGTASSATPSPTAAPATSAGRSSRTPTPRTSATRSSSAHCCSCSLSYTCARSRAVPGPRSVRASRPRSPPA